MKLTQLANFYLIHFYFNIKNNLQIKLLNKTITSGLPAESQYVLIVLYTLTASLAVSGNLLVLAVFSFGRRSRTDLRPFLVNLAVADLVMAVFCMPFTFTYTMLHDWIFGDVMCPLVLFCQMVSWILEFVLSLFIFYFFIYFLVEGFFQLFPENFILFLDLDLKGNVFS